MARTFAFCQVALSGVLAFGGAFLGTGGAAWAQGGPALKWAAHEMWPGADAHDEGVDIVHWAEDPVVGMHWVYVTGSVTEVDAQGQVVGTRFATFKYDAAFYDNGNPPPPEAFAYFPADPQVPTDGIYKAVAMALDKNTGDIYITGQAKNPNGSDQDYAIIRYDKNLVPVWPGGVKYYNGPVSGDDIPADIALDVDGTVVVVTGTSDNGVDVDIATVALDKVDGSPMADAWPENQWGPPGVRRFDDGGDDRAVAVGGVEIKIEGPDDLVLTAIVLGTTWNGANDDFTTHSWGDGLFAKGILRWNTPFDGGGEDVATALWADGSAWVYVVGRSEKLTSFGPTGSGGTDYDFATESYASATGVLRWSQRWDYTGAADYPLDIYAEFPHVWVVGGGTSGSEVHAITLLYVEDLQFVGQLEWAAAFAYVDGGVHYFNAVTISEQDDILVTGAVDDGVEDAVLVVKYKWVGSPDPYEFAWHRVYGTRDGFDEGRAIVTARFPAVGTKLNIYTVGAAAFPNQSSDLVTLRHEEE